MVVTLLGIALEFMHYSSCMGCKVQTWKHFLKICISSCAIWCIYFVVPIRDLLPYIWWKCLKQLLTCVGCWLTLKTLHCSLQAASAVMTFAFDSANKNVMASSTTGSFTVQEVKKKYIKSNIPIDSLLKTQESPAFLQSISFPSCYWKKEKKIPCQLQLITIIINYNPVMHNLSKCIT